MYTFFGTCGSALLLSVLVGFSKSNIPTVKEKSIRCELHTFTCLHCYTLFKNVLVYKYTRFSEKYIIAFLHPVRMLRDENSSAFICGFTSPWSQFSIQSRFTVRFLHAF